MSALALPQPMPFRPPMGGGLVGGGVAPPITLEQVLYYLENNIKPNAGQLFPVPPPLVFGGFLAGIAFAIVFEGLFTAPTASAWLPEPEVEPIEPGNQPTEERVLPPATPHPGIWTYRNVVSFDLRRFVKIEPLPGKYQFPEYIDDSIIRSADLGMSPQSLDLQLTSATSEWIQSADVNNNYSSIPVATTELRRTDDGTPVQNPALATWMGDQGTTNTGGEGGSGKESKTTQWYVIENIQYVPDGLFPRPGQKPGPINPQPVAYPAPDINPIRKQDITPAPAQVPDIIYQPDTLPQIVPAPIGVPLTEPAPSTSPDVEPLPLFVPAVPPPSIPTTTRPTAPDGAIVPSPPAPVPTTPDNAHFPVPGGPPVNDGGVAPTLQGIAAEVGRIEQKTAQLLNRSGGSDLTDWLWLLPFLADFFQSDIPGTNYQLQGVCETVGEGEEQPVAEFPVEPAPNIWAVINRLDVIDNMLQQHLAWKTPTCSNAKPPLEGSWVSTHWMSDSASPGGLKPLRKLFRYRTKSDRSTNELQDYWRAFTWEAGPVRVHHKGAWWGTPAVWAASAEEGQRVIRFAAAEAGFDPDQVGEWGTSSSSSPRYGMPGTMRLMWEQGERWVTRREGPSGLPEL